VIFLYRDSSHLHKKADGDDSTDNLSRHSPHFISFLRRMIRLHGKTTYTILRASAVKSALMPQFSEDLTLEFEMSTSGLTLLQTSSDSAVKQSVYAWACRARIFTELIGAHVIHAIPRRQNLIIVSNGINASSTNWTRIQAYMDLVRKAYGDIMLVIRLPEAASTERLHTMCPHEDPHFRMSSIQPARLQKGRILECSPGRQSYLSYRRETSRLRPGITKTLGSVCRHVGR
jgi:hypothetical protein